MAGDTSGWWVWRKGNFDMRYLPHLTFVVCGEPSTPVRLGVLHREMLLLCDVKMDVFSAAFSICMKCHSCLYLHVYLM